MSEPSIKTRALQGSVWTIGGYGLSQVLRLLGHLVLAWFLAPEIFGLMALVMVFMHGLTLFSDFGIGTSIIQSKRGRDPEFLNTAWTIQIIRGIGLWVFTLLAAKPFSLWYAQNDPAAAQLEYLLPVVAFSAVLNGFTSPKLSLLNKEMQFSRLTMVEIGTQAVSLAVMIGWALIQPSVWAMVAGFLAAAFSKMVVSHFLLPGDMVRVQWDQQCFRELFRFGKWIFLSTAFTFLATQMDRVVLGKLLSLADLGLYGIALSFAMVAVQVANKLGNIVLFPIHSKFQDQPVKLMEVALRARETILWIGAGVCISFALGAPLFFETLWDPRYHQAGVFAQWLTLLVWVRILLCTMDRIPLALGNSRALFFANIVQTCGILIAIIGYWLSGVAGFIVGLSVGPIAAHLFLTLYIPSKRLEMLRQSIRFTLGAGFLGVILVGLTIWLKMSVMPIYWIAAVTAGVTISLVVSGLSAYRLIKV